MKLDQAVQDQIAALAADEGLELLATEIAGNGPKTVLRLVIDGPDGVGLDQCAAISRQASVILDVEDPIRHRYTLEVTSPGLDRKFYRRADYERFVGRRVKVRMEPSYRDHRAVVGELRGLQKDVVQVLGDDGVEINLPFEAVHETRLEIDWNTILKEGKSHP